MKKLLLIPMFASFLAFNSCKTQKNLSSNLETPKQEIKADNYKNNLEKIIKNYSGDKDTIIFKNKFYKINLRINPRTGKKEISKTENYVYNKLIEKEKTRIQTFDYEFARKIVQRCNILENMPKSKEDIIRKFLSNKRLFSTNIKEFYEEKTEIYLEKHKYNEAINYLEQTDKVVKNFIPKNANDKMFLERYSNYLIEKENEIKLKKKQNQMQKPGVYKFRTKSGLDLIVLITKYKNIHHETYGREYDAIKKTRFNLVNYVKSKYGKSVKKIAGQKIFKNEQISKDSSRAVIIYQMIQNKKLTKKIFDCEPWYKPYKE